MGADSELAFYRLPRVHAQRIVSSFLPDHSTTGKVNYTEFNLDGSLEPVGDNCEGIECGFYSTILTSGALAEGSSGSGLINFGEAPRGAFQVLAASGNALCRPREWMARPREWMASALAFCHFFLQWRGPFTAGTDLSWLTSRPECTPSHDSAL